MFTAYSVKFVKMYKNYASGVLDEAKTRFTPSISRESINAASASREYENSEYICTFYINVNSCQYDFVKRFKNYVSGVLDEAKTRFTPSISRESSNAAPASREYEISVYTVQLH
jgi:hypothetical protein